jgi:hypothetical protein
LSHFRREKREEERRELESLYFLSLFLKMVLSKNITRHAWLHAALLRQRATYRIQ